MNNLVKQLVKNILLTESINFDDIEDDIVDESIIDRMIANEMLSLLQTNKIIIDEYGLFKGIENNYIIFESGEIVIDFDVKHRQIIGDISYSQYIKDKIKINLNKSLLYNINNGFNNTDFFIPSYNMYRNYGLTDETPYELTDFIISYGGNLGVSSETNINSSMCLSDIFIQNVDYDNIINLLTNNKIKNMSLKSIIETYHNSDLDLNDESYCSIPVFCKYAQSTDFLKQLFKQNKYTYDDFLNENE